MEEWKEYKLKDVTSVLGDGIHGTPKYDENGTVFFINGNNLENGKIIIKENTRRVSVEESIKHRKPLTDRTILVSINGTLGNVARYNGEPCILGKSACYFNVKEEFDLIFIYYVVANGEFRKDIERLATGTTIKNVSLETMRNYTFYAPSLKTQKQIASILKSLDDKIEVNRKINENLEQQAQALFKSWFVDFEPFKNGEFVESELGMIPKGWRVDRIEDVSQKMASGGTPKSLNKEYYSGNIKWFSTKELKDCFLFDSEKHISEDALNNSSAKIFPEGTVLMAIYAAPTVGRLGILTSPATFNQAAVGIVPKENVGSEFVYLSLLSERTNLNNLASGAAQQNLNVGIVKNYIILVPEQKILDRFNRIVKGVFNLLKKNSDESRRLAELRDTLLPKLMSGELKVNEIDNSL